MGWQPFPSCQSPVTTACTMHDRDPILAVIMVQEKEEGILPQPVFPTQNGTEGIIFPVIWLEMQYTAHSHEEYVTDIGSGLVLNLIHLKLVLVLFGHVYIFLSPKIARILHFMKGE